MSVGTGAIAGVVGELGRATSGPDRSVTDRIARERDRAMAHQLLASALFERIDVLGIQEATVHGSAHAPDKGRLIERKTRGVSLSLWYGWALR
jgi:hypothetical protein